jgi:hypothetical protein
MGGHSTRVIVEKRRRERAEQKAAAKLARKLARHAAKESSDGTRSLDPDPPAAPSR